MTKYLDGRTTAVLMDRLGLVQAHGRPAIAPQVAEDDALPEGCPDMEVGVLEVYNLQVMEPYESEEGLTDCSLQHCSVCEGIPRQGGAYRPERACDSLVFPEDPYPQVEFPQATFGC